VAAQLPHSSIPVGVVRQDLWTKPPQRSTKGGGGGSTVVVSEMSAWPSLHVVGKEPLEIST
jgi:hypothetical protein